MRGNSREQPRQSDPELAASLGEDFGLGKVLGTARARLPGTVAAVGVILALGAVCVAIPVFAFDANVINAAVFGGLFLLGCLLAVLGTARSPVTGRLFWYDGGLVQLNGDEPDPRILRWADAETVIYGYREGNDQVPTKLSRYILHGGTGTEPIEITCSRDAGYPPKVLQRLLVETASVLASRLVPPLIEIYKSGEPVIVGRVRIDGAGITVGWPTDRRVTWGEVDSIAAYPLGRLTATRIIYEIIIIDRSASSVSISLGGVPNGMFLPHLLAHAAARNGIWLYTQHADLLAPWQAISE